MTYTLAVTTYVRVEADSEADARIRALTATAPRLTKRVTYYRPPTATVLYGEPEEAPR